MTKFLRTIAPTLTLATLLFASSAVRAEDKPKEPASVTPAVKGRPGNPDAEAQFLKRHEGFLKDKEETLKKGPIDLLFVGDSITDGWRNGKQHELFLERWGKHNPLNIGISGDRTQHVLWRLDNHEVDGIKPKLIVLMIGTNNIGTKETPEDAALGIERCVTVLREKLPESKILLLAVFPRGEKADNPFRGQLKTINDRIMKLDDEGKHVKFLDIGPKFLAEDGTLTKEIMPDALHPNLKGYGIWADAISPTVEEMMK